MSSTSLVVWTCNSSLFSRLGMAALTIFVFTFSQLLAAHAAAAEKIAVNSLGMKLIAVAPGSFQMGSKDGDFDEQPVHRVTIRRPFSLAATEVSNAQYERFDPKHKQFRGQRGLSRDDDEAVIFVSWREAVAFCRWLSQKEGKPYRLPTEAEWEYACRAGTTTPYFTGANLPAAFLKNQKFSWDPQPVPLHVAHTPANAWGFCDMHGNVEEWCYDTYGPYPSEPQTDPLGCAHGEMKVTRGGSHNTEVFYLRSANRSGTLPDDRHWLIGFRVVQGELPAGKPLPPQQPPLWARDVKQTKATWPAPPQPQAAYFAEPETFVHIPAGSNGPLFSQHNHCPSITWCENGDLLAVWFSTNTERGREMTIAASRRRAGAPQWDPASEFFKAPDRNMTGSALFHDGRGTLYHFNGLEAAGGWGNLALVLRSSTDNGVTWSTRLINPWHQRRNQVISGTLRTAEGYLIQACDAGSGRSGGSAIHLSRDGGATWLDPGAGTPPPDYQGDQPGGTIAGIHAGVVQLAGGRLMAFGRGNNRFGADKSLGRRMPQSISDDFGKSWHYAATPWVPLNGGQRLVLMRLREGPIFFASFTDTSETNQIHGMTFIDRAGKSYTGYGLFVALSFDEGKSWPVRKLVTAAGMPRKLRGGAWTGEFTMDGTHAEPRGYLAATQTPDGRIQLISSALHYQFNLVWIQERSPAVVVP
jgi:formylglycine-generating enzyme